VSPLLVLSFFFCSGILMAFFLRIPFLPVYCMTAPALFACWLIRQPRAADLGLSMAVLLIGWCCAACHAVVPATGIDSYPAQRRASVQGIVTEVSETIRGRCRISLTVERVIAGTVDRKASGKCIVFLKGDGACASGDRILATGELLPCMAVFPLTRAGYVRHLANHGFTRVLVCNRWELVVAQKQAAGKAQKVFGGIKEKFLAVLRSRLSPQASAMMQAMVLGEKKGVSPLISAAMINSGTIHILVVSGFNVGVVSFMLLAVLKILRIPRKARFWFLLPCVAVYCLITGASEPVVRAGIMAAVIAAACLGNRDGDIQNAFALAMCAMLYLNPRLLFDASFQLSFVSVFSLIAVYPYLRRLAGIERLKHMAARFFAEGMLVSFSAWLGTAGFVAYYFHIITPGAVLTNILAAPLAGFITVCGFTLIIADAILPVAARFIAITADYAICLLVHIVSFRFLVFPLSR
jgi:competence protein ComEC